MALLHCHNISGAGSTSINLALGHHSVFLDFVGGGVGGERHTLKQGWVHVEEAS